MAAARLARGAAALSRRRGLQATLAVLASAACQSRPSSQATAWAVYHDPGGRFALEYPPSTRPKQLPADSSGLVSRVRFPFLETFRQGDDAGSLQFNFEVNVWNNPSNLDGARWAAQVVDSRMALETVATRLASRPATRVTVTNFASHLVRVFVADDAVLYEVAYADARSNRLLSAEQRRNWAHTFDAMSASLRIAGVAFTPAKK